MDVIPLKDAIAVMQKRYSCRTYATTPIAEDKLAQLQSAMAALNNTVFRLKIISIDAGEKLGTYGFIKNAKLFVVCAVKRDFYENSPEVCGFLFEEFVLAATSLGINTCWLGGTFTRSRFAEQIDLKDDELIPYISPIGIAADKKRWFDRTLRSLAKADSRLDASLLFFQGDLQHPLDLASIGDYAQALQMVRIAPSASNKQPWRVVKVGNLYHFYLLRNQGYAKPSGVDLQASDMGIALCHFAYACRELKLTATYVKLEQAPLFENHEYIGSYEC